MIVFIMIINGDSVYKNDGNNNDGYHNDDSVNNGNDANDNDDSVYDDNDGYNNDIVLIVMMVMII